MIPGMKHLSVKSGMKSIEFSLLFMLIRLYENLVHPKIQSLPGRLNAFMEILFRNSYTCQAEVCLRRLVSEPPGANIE